VQVLDPGTGPEIPIPNRPPDRALGFGELLAAQAAGDLKVLQDRGRVAGRVDLDELLEAAS
jgi:hypothetical protein